LSRLDGYAVTLYPLFAHAIEWLDQQVEVAKAYTDVRDFYSDFQAF
jgi:hypothetical protein